ncbi:Trypanosomal VSG domain/Trypanosome variant surface glycoprotein C-terminal domain containing protein, putative [Trypanosoma equiperdum]|uniref:Trypanosomal VSG domain/Trypanosome variant surface glycoprotein C-terminal domain containing protein, putative n=1 Tax=Trypanosoma equiperdum TaxID=5694 RepID=A0A1G4IK30_TRYEQ|nr:Trypanosomal VSG domain/Trypanosome variant surface glycoprotein C-terminal domain containing protein, putative [Trypanosoma equiperdum]
MDTKLSELKQHEATARAGAVAGMLKQALGAQPDGSSEIKLTGATANRADSCGKPNDDTAGTAAGKTIAGDVVCMCTSDNSNQQNKACGASAQTADLQFGPSPNIQAQWKTLGDACGNQNNNEKLTGAAIRSATAAFNVAVNTGQGTNSKLAGVLGLIKGPGNTGCNGSNDGNGGSCIFYEPDPATKAVKKPAWLEQLESAAANLEAAERAASHAHASSAQLQSLNATITSLILLGSSTKKKQAAATQKPTETTTIGKTEQEAASRECAQHKSNKTICENANKCKWKGKSETDGPCEVDESKVATQTNAAGTGETANTEAKKCSEKKTKVCANMAVSWMEKNAKIPLF